MNTLNNIDNSEVKLNQSELYILQVALKQIETFFSVYNKINGHISNSMNYSDGGRYLNFEDLIRPSKTNASMPLRSGHSSVSKEYTSNFQGPENGIDRHISSSVVDSFLSIELMETQNKLKRAMLRLEVMEMVNAKKSEDTEENLMEENDISSVSHNFLKHESIDWSLFNKGVNSPSGSHISYNANNANNANYLNDSTISQSSKSKQDQEVTYEQIMSHITLLKEQIAQRGSKSLLYGTLLNSSAALIPLEKNIWVDSDDNVRSDQYDEFADHSRPSLPLSSASLSDVLSAIDSYTKSTADANDAISLSNNKHYQRDIDILKERIVEQKLLIEQRKRDEENMSTLLVELQILREKVLKMTSIEAYANTIKQKNLELEKKLKESSKEMVLLKQQHEQNLHNSSNSDIANKQIQDSEAMILKLKEELYAVNNVNSQMKKDTQISNIALRQTEERVKVLLKENLLLNQKVNSIEDQNISLKTDMMELNATLKHFQSIEEEKFELLKSNQLLENSIIDYKTKIFECQEEIHANSKVKEELLHSDMRISDLQEKLTRSESVIQTMKMSLTEIDDVKLQLKQKVNENREFNARLRLIGVSENELRNVQSRLEATQHEISAYKLKVEQCAPMLAELARLRGASRAAVVSLQEQDKIILSLQEKNQANDAINQEYIHKIKTYENIESQLIDIEKENQELQRVVSEDVPKMKLALQQMQEEKKLLEIQLRQIKKNSRQTAITNSVQAAAAAFMTNLSHNDGISGKQQSA